MACPFDQCEGQTLCHSFLILLSEQLVWVLRVHQPFLGAARVGSPSSSAQVQWEPLRRLDVCGLFKRSCPKFLGRWGNIGVPVVTSMSLEISPVVVEYRSVNSCFSFHGYFLTGTCQKLGEANRFIKLQVLSVACPRQVWAEPGKLIQRLLSTVNLILN